MGIDVLEFTVWSGVYLAGLVGVSGVGTVIIHFGCYWKTSTLGGGNSLFISHNTLYYPLTSLYSKHTALETVGRKKRTGCRRETLSINAQSMPCLF